MIWHLFWLMVAWWGSHALTAILRRALHGKPSSWEPNHLTVPDDPQGVDQTALERGKPELMSTETLIEWIQRQLETKAETEARCRAKAQAHRRWHETHLGIVSGCCIQTGAPQEDQGSGS